MTTIERIQKSPEELAEYWDYRRMTFQSKDTRDTVHAILKQRGYRVVRRSIRNCRLHPEYIADYVGCFEVGFGNTDYMSEWNNLYTIEGV
jgi:hypothetical protein